MTTGVLWLAILLLCLAIAASALSNRPAVIGIARRDAVARGLGPPPHGGPPPPPPSRRRRRLRRPRHTATAGGGTSEQARRARPVATPKLAFNVPPGPQVYPRSCAGRGRYHDLPRLRLPSAAISKDRIASDLDVPGFQRLSIAMVGDGTEAANYVMDVDRVTGLEDRGTSMSTSIDSHLGYRAVRGISIDFVPQRTRNANRIEIFCNARSPNRSRRRRRRRRRPTARHRSSSTSSPPIFVCSEHVRQVTSTVARVRRRGRSRGTTRTTGRGGGDGGGAREDDGNLLTAAYLDAGDPMFFDEPNRPVIVYSHDLVATGECPKK
ncbi:hypothetical protein ACHAW5_003515 [Stephanodiscus triporus]|uniref:Uncharacterized protein n=1 Tax=Stephanodiscus triporus TaxID=2934178 RepID=A0ABD3NP17_9STRA